MAVYEYKGLTQEGRSVSGIMEADTPKTARLKLRQTGVFPVEVLESHQARVGAAPLSAPERMAGQAPAGGLGVQWLGERVTVQEVALLTRQMATLVSAGLPLLEVLSVVAEQSEKRLLKRTIAQVREVVKEGGSLADAL